MQLEIVLAALAALAMSAAACRMLISYGLLDVPSQARHQHKAPNRTGGGIGIGLGVGAGMGALWQLSTVWRAAAALQGALLLALLAFAYGFLLLGIVDDARALGPRLKGVLFTALALGGAWMLGVVLALPLGGGAVLHLGFWLGLFGTGLWVFTLVNCVNFMDGANGLAMGSVMIGLLTLAAIALDSGSAIGAALSLVGAGALAGFLVWNFRGGRLFAGDSGALFAGALAALGALLIMRETGLSPFAPPIVFFPLLADALLTLAWRAGRGRSLLEGHSEHLYQIALRAGWSHERVALTYWAAMAVCGAIGFWVAGRSDAEAPWLALAVLAVASLLISSAVRHYAVKHGIAEA